jgi:hypothetical protein
MNKPLITALCLLLTLGYTSQPVQASGPKYAPETQTLSTQNSYFKSTTSTDFWNLAPYYLPQHNGKACSVASVTMVMNALRAEQKLSASDELFTSEKLLKLEPSFAKATGQLGRGMTLDELQQNTQKALDRAYIGKYVVELYRFDSGDKNKELARLKMLLSQNEKDSKNMMIANFLQGTLTGDPEGNIGHISPIAAYDEKTDRVLILDTDRQYYEPYWVSTAKLLEALNSLDSGSKKLRGLVWVRLK